MVVLSERMSAFGGMFFSECCESDQGCSDVRFVLQPTVLLISTCQFTFHVKLSSSRFHIGASLLVRTSGLAQRYELQACRQNERHSKVGVSCGESE